MPNDARSSEGYDYLCGDCLSIISSGKFLQDFSPFPPWKVIVDANLFCCGGYDSVQDRDRFGFLAAQIGLFFSERSRRVGLKNQNY